jgi:hypothetical protein
VNVIIKYALSFKIIDISAAKIDKKSEITNFLGRNIKNIYFVWLDDRNLVPLQPILEN